VIPTTRRNERRDGVKTLERHVDELDEAYAGLVG
jgi:hypothetical protein